MNIKHTRNDLVGATVKSAADFALSRHFEMARWAVRFRDKQAIHSAREWAGYAREQLALYLRAVELEQEKGWIS